MARMTNTPLRPLNFDLERRKSYSWQSRLVNGDKSPVDLSGCVLRFVVKEQDWDDDQFDMTNLIFNCVGNTPNPLTGVTQFDFQAAELDWPADEYNYALVLRTADGLPSGVLEGVFNVVADAESGSRG